MSRARRYKEIKEELKALELNRGSHLYIQLQELLKPLREETSGLVNQKDGRATEISRDETELETVRLQLTEKEKALVEIQEALSEIVEQIHRREGDIRVGKERISSLEERITRYSQEIVTLNQRLEEQKSHLDVAARDRETLQVKITSTNRLFINKKNELGVFQQGLNLKRLELNQHKKQIIGCLEEMSRLNTEETQLRAQNDGNRGRLERLDEEDKNYQTTLDRVRVEQKERESVYQIQVKKRQKAMNHRERLSAE